MEGGSKVANLHCGAGMVAPEHWPDDCVSGLAICVVALDISHFQHCTSSLFFSCNASWDAHSLHQPPSNRTFLQLDTTHGPVNHGGFPWPGMQACKHDVTLYLCCDAVAMICLFVNFAVWDLWLFNNCSTRVCVLTGLLLISEAHGAISNNPKPRAM
jgi:hypothetical protein